METLNSIKNEYDVMVTIYEESRDFQHYLQEEYVSVYDIKNLEFVGYTRRTNNE